MRIKLILILLLPLACLGQPILVNLNNGNTGQVLTKSSNATFDYTWTTVDFNTLAPSKTGNALKYLRVNAGETGYELVAIAGGGDMLGTNNLSDVANAGTSLTNLGGTTIGKNVFTATNPGAIRYFKVNADNTFSFRTAAEMLSDIGAQASGSYATGTGTANGTNTGDQTSIVGITGTFAQFNTAVTDAELARTDAANTFTGVQTMTSPAITTPTGIVKGDIGLGNVDNTSNVTERTASAVLTTKTIATFNYAADAGSNDTYVIALSPAATSYTTGMIVFFKANTVNTGAASINVNSLGAKTIVKRVSTTLANGDIPALSFKMLIYDGTNFVLINPVVN